MWDILQISGRERTNINGIVKMRQEITHNYPVYQFIRANKGWGNWDMILIETKACNDSQDARRVER